jgi:hypothetical protein
MTRKLLILGALAGAACALPTCASEKSSANAATVAAGKVGTIECRGQQFVPATVDAEQSLPLQVAARLNCGSQVAIVSDAEGYTVAIRTAEGQSGYVARIYVAESASRANARAADAAVDNGIARWQAGTVGSDEFFTNGSLVESLTANGVTVQVSLQDTDWKLRAHVAISNDSAESVAFDPRGFTLDELKPRLRSLTYQNPRDLAKALTHQVYWTNVSATAPASAMVMNAAYRNPGNVPATPNYLAQDAQQVLTQVMRARTLAPKEKASGVVWFERDKNLQELTLRVFVNDLIFEFPLSFPPR